jgi:hypothetical protein
MSGLVQIVPGGNEPAEALFQSAALLARALSPARSVESPGVVGGSDRGGLRSALAAARAGDTVLLHYVGYGYAPRGAPLWLAGLLERWRRGGSGRRLLVHFHEVAASGPPWRSSFWLAPLQRRVAARIGRLASGAITSLGRYRRMLRRLAPALRVEVLPIFSAIGEPAAVVPCAQRESVLVLFGSPSARAEIWRRHSPALEQAVRALAIDRVHDIGGEPVAPPAIGGAVVERVGAAESAHVGELLSTARAAFFGYPLDYLDKSSAFAAVCAHGVLPVCAGRRDRPGPAAGEGERWLSAHALERLPLERAAEVAAAARRWYEGHDLRHHAETWRRFLGG